MPDPNVGVQGDDYLISIHDGTNDIVIEHQGDATYNTGVTQQKTKTKTSSVPYQQKEGATLSLSFIKMRPLTTGQQLLWDASTTGDIVQITYDDPNPGGQKRVGNAQVSRGEETANVEGLVSVPFTVAFLTDPVETVNA